MNTNIMRASRRVRLASSTDRFLSLLFYSCLFVSIRGLKILADHRTTRFHSSLGSAELWSGYFLSFEDHEPPMDTNEHEYYARIAPGSSGFIG